MSEEVVEAPKKRGRPSKATEPVEPVDVDLEDEVVGEEPTFDDDKYSIVVMAWNRNRSRTEIDPTTGEARDVDVDPSEKRFFTLKVRKEELNNQGIDFCFAYNRKLEKMKKQNRASIIDILSSSEAKEKGIERATMTPDDFFRKMNREDTNVD